MKRGLEAINYLAGIVSDVDSQASSHWRKYHSDFKFDENGFKGLLGFGGNQPPYSGIKRLLNATLQHKFKRLGAKFTTFDDVDKQALLITSVQHRAYDLDVLRQVITVSFLNSYLPDVMSREKIYCVIGDGFASITNLLLRCNPEATIILVNLNKTLLVDLWYLNLFMGNEEFEEQVVLAVDSDSLNELFDRHPDNHRLPKVIALQAVNHHLLRSMEADLVINIASMQEMNPDVVADYFTDIRVMAATKPLYFYCCNREEKVLPDGTISSFEDYPWSETDHVIVDELCPWHQEYYAFRPPFYRAYDGAHRHRLAQISPIYGDNT